MLWLQPVALLVTVAVYVAADSSFLCFRFRGGQGRGVGKGNVLAGISQNISRTPRIAGTVFTREMCLILLLSRIM